MKTLGLILLYIGILLGVYGAGLAIGYQSREQVVLPEHTMYDVTLECQKLSAIAGEKWGYKSCVEELGKTIQSGVMLSI